MYRFLFKATEVTITALCFVSTMWGLACCWHFFSFLKCTSLVFPLGLWWRVCSLTWFILSSQVPAVQQTSSSTACSTTPWGCAGALLALRSTTTQWICTALEPTTRARQLPAADTATSRRRYAERSIAWWCHRWAAVEAKWTSVNPGPTQVGPAALAEGSVWFCLVTAEWK